MALRHQASSAGIAAQRRRDAELAKKRARRAVLSELTSVKDYEKASREDEAMRKRYADHIPEGERAMFEHEELDDEVR
jgi:hypothetical protein